MRPLLRVFPAVLALVLPALPLSSSSQLPLAFEPNLGQADPCVKFLARGDGYGLFITAAEVILTLRGPSPAVVRLKWHGAAADAPARGIAALPGRSNYMAGKDPGKWRRGIPSYARVRLEGVYPGISIEFYGSQRRLEYDLIVAGDADPARIQMGFEGIESMRLDGGGDLVLRAGSGEIRQHKPVIYQETGTAREPVPGGYVLRGNGHVAFWLGAHDRTRPLNIDPVLSYSSFLGGDGGVAGGADYARAAAVDAAGNVYLAGSTESTAFPVTGDAAQAKRAGDLDAFLIKLDPSGTTRLYATYLGGEGRDEALAVSVDSGGNAYLAGATTSRKFPASAGSLRTTLSGPQNAFAAKFDPAGAVVYATLLGGEGVDSGAAIAADDSGNAYVAGSTTSAGFPVTPGAYQPTRNGSQNGFVVKLDPAGGSLLYGTYLGAGTESISAMAVDGAGNAYLAGKTSSRTFPLTAGVYQTARRATDAFIVKLDPTGANLVYSTLFGGSGTDSANALALDSTGSVWIAGQTDSPDLPLTKGAAQSKFGGGDADGFIAKLDAKGAALLYASYLGGSKRDVANAVAADTGGNVFVAGETASRDFPVSDNALQAAYGGGPSDAFILALDGKTLARRYATYVGGSGDDRATALAAAANGGALAAGYTNSGNFPATPDALQPALAPGGMDPILTRWSADGALEYSTCLGGSGSVANEEALDVAVDGDGNVYVTGRTFSLNFPVTDGAVEGSHPSSASGDAFVTKIAPDGKSLVFSTYLGGSGDDSGVGIAVDSGGNVFVGGTTASADFPTTAGAWQTALRTSSSAFAAKLSADGSSLIYSTLLSGGAQSTAAGMAVDAGGNAYLAGSTTARDFPTSEGAVQTAHAGGITDAFVSKISADGSRLVYSTLLGGEDRDSASAIAVDSGGNAYVTGATASKSFPVTGGALQAAHAGGGTDAFVVKLEAAGAALPYATLLGGTGADEGHRVVVDSTGSAYVTGTTGSPDFPVSAEAYQKTHIATAAFVSRLNPAGSTLVYSTFLGGGSGDSGNGLAVDSAGNAYVAGCVGSRGFPVSQDAFQKTHGDGYWDAFVTKLDSAGKALLFSTYFGGNGEDRINALALDSAGNAYVAGYTSSANYPVTAGAFQPRLAGPRNGLVAKVDFTRATPIPAISRVVNYVTEAEFVAPGSVIAVLGKDLSAGTAEFAKPLDKLSGSLPVQLAGTTVTYVCGADKRSLPLFSVSPEKIVAQMPFAAQGIVQVMVTAGGRDSQWANARLAEPAIGISSVVKADLTPITRESPVRPGDVMIATVTGAGRTDPSLATGAPAPADIAVTVRGQPYVQIAQPGATARCDIQSFTLVPGTAGIAQARLRIPTWVSSDNVEWDLTMNGGAESNKVRVYVYAPAP